MIQRRSLARLAARGFLPAGVLSEGFAHNLRHFLLRLVSSRAEGQEIAKELHSSRVTPRVIPYQLTADQAIVAFEQWHKDKYLSPGALLSRAASPLRQAALPFWLFEASIQVHYRGVVGAKSSTGEEQWEEIAWINKGVQTFPWTLPAMQGKGMSQVYASYKYRRDLVEATKAFGMLGRSKALTHSQAVAKEAPIGKNGDNVDLDTPDMRQPIAWEFALLAVRRQEEAEARRALGQGLDKRVRDVEVKLKTTQRRSRLVFLPAFILNYYFGEHFNVDGVRRPEAFQAVIGGQVDSAVAAERHFSPAKVQVAAAAGMGSVATVTAALGLQGQNLISPATFLSMLLICTSIGLAARLSPMLLRQHQEDQRLQVEEQDMEKLMSQGMGPSDIMDDKHEGIRTASEWRRWEEANKWSWEGTKRKRWAESLWRRQQIRRLQKRAFKENLAKAEARYKFEQHQEAKRRARWGYRQQNVFADTESGGARKDFMGYYTLLGLDADVGSTFSQPDIKKAFHEAALRWHPDHLHVADEADREKAHSQFAKVRKAYEVLRSPDRRKQYDNGIDPS